MKEEGKNAVGDRIPYRLNESPGHGYTEKFWQEEEGF
jgi:hypothetical protein